MKFIFSIFIALLLFSCERNSHAINEDTPPTSEQDDLKPREGVSIIVLGTVQDAGSPQLGCKKDCCKDLFEQPNYRRKVVSLGLVDSPNKKKYIFEASPDFVSQAELMTHYGFLDDKEVPDGIFLTHAHIGHYTGLMYLGKEAMNSNEVPVYAMPKMKKFLTENGPWSQLVSAKNIVLNDLINETELDLTSNIKIIPFTVPHRDEFSETVGYKIIGPKKSALFIPDIDKWGKWEKDIIKEIAKVDYAFIDATFFDGEEINNRDISEIPHPFIIESMELFKDLSKEEKSKIYFFHFNHTNPVLVRNSAQALKVLDAGFNIAQYADTFIL